MRYTLLRPIATFAALAAALCFAELWAASWLVRSPATALLAGAITLDLLVGLPILFGLLLVQRLRLPWMTLAPVAVLAAVVAYRILPPNYRAPLDTLAQLLPLVELALAAYVALQLRSLWRAYHAERSGARYVSDALDAAVRRMFGDTPFARVLAVELLLVGLALGGWFARYHAPRATMRTFTMHREGVYGAFLFVVALLLVGEALAAHLLVAHFWNDTAAWVLTALSAYGLLWLVGDFHALRLHPLVLEGETLHLRRGLLWRGSVLLDTVAGVRRPQRGDEKRADFVSLAPVGQGEFLLVLCTPVEVLGLLGMRRSVTLVGLSVDECAAFGEALGLKLPPGYR
jgi:hypothetical protein